MLRSVPAVTVALFWVVVECVLLLVRVLLSTACAAVMLTSRVAVMLVVVPLLSTPPVLLTSCPALMVRLPAASTRAALSTKSVRSVAEPRALWCCSGCCRR